MLTTNCVQWEQGQTPQHHLLSLVLITLCLSPHIRFPQETFVTQTTSWSWDCQLIAGRGGLHDHQRADPPCCSMTSDWSHDPETQFLHVEIGALGSCANRFLKEVVRMQFAKCFVLFWVPQSHKQSLLASIQVTMIRSCLWWKVS